MDAQIFSRRIPLSYLYPLALMPERNLLEMDLWYYSKTINISDA
jgi:hypothetical protein